MKLDKSDLQLETIVSRINAGELDLQPDFQRGEIWDTKRRQRLVDTILREWYVPAIHIVVDTDGEEVVLDGQQRLAAIRDFFADKVKIDGTIEPHDELVASLNGLKYSRAATCRSESCKQVCLAHHHSQRVRTPGAKRTLLSAQSGVQSYSARKA